MRSTLSRQLGRWPTVKSAKGTVKRREYRKAGTVMGSCRNEPASKAVASLILLPLIDKKISYVNAPLSNCSTVQDAQITYVILENQTNNNLCALRLLGGAERPLIDASWSSSIGGCKFLVCL